MTMNPKTPSVPGLTSTPLRSTSTDSGVKFTNLEKSNFRDCIKVQPGEYYVTNDGTLIATTLGSCIAACIRDRVKGIGGMNHFMLPYKLSNFDSWDNSTISRINRYGNHAMENLVNDILKLGGDRNNLELKVFGGGRILKHMTDIGQRNIEFIENYIVTEGLDLVAKDVGSIYPRKVIYDPMTGKAKVKKLSTPHKDNIAKRENQYLNDIQTAPVAGNIELF